MELLKQPGYCECSFMRSGELSSFVGFVTLCKRRILFPFYFEIKAMTHKNYLSVCNNKSLYQYSYWDIRAPNRMQNFYGALFIPWLFHGRSPNIFVSRSSSPFTVFSFFLFFFFLFLSKIFHHISTLLWKSCRHVTLMHGYIYLCCLILCLRMKIRIRKYLTSQTEAQSIFNKFVWSEIFSIHTHIH